MRRHHSFGLVVVVAGLLLACGGAAAVTPGPEPTVPAVNPPAPSPAPERPAGPEAVEVVQYGTVYDTACAACTREPPCVVTEVRASSTLTEGKLVHAASRALDGDQSTAWCEGDENAGQGSSLTFSLPEGCGLYGVLLHGGYFKSATHLPDNARAKAVELRAGGRSARADLTDPATVPFEAASRAPAFVELGWDPPGRTLTLVFTDVYPGRGSPTDLCVSEVDVMLSPREDGGQ
jgi:hypothetical protein